MDRPLDDELRCIHEDLRRRQWRGTGPQPIAEAMSALLARRGYAGVEAAAERDAAWLAAAGENLAPFGRLGNIRRGVLEVIVSHSVALQEFTAQKKQLLEKIVAALPDQKIHDLRFRIGAVK